MGGERRRQPITTLMYVGSTLHKPTRTSIPVQPFFYITSKVKPLCLRRQNKKGSVFFGSSEASYESYKLCKEDYIYIGNLANN